MYFPSTLAAVAGAALFSVASASPVCRLKSSNSNSGWQPAVVPQGPSTQNAGGWQNSWQNLDGNTIIIRTTTLSHGSCNPPATGAPGWATYGSSPTNSVAPGYSYAATVTGGQGWAGWAGATTTGGGVVGPTGFTTSTTSGTGVVSPTALSTTSTATLTTGSPISQTTTATTTTTSTSTTTTTTTTTSPVCPNAPTGTFYLQATNAANTALEGHYAGLANNGFGNLVAFSETDTTNAVQVTFDVDCTLISAVGPLIVLDDGTTPAPTEHYQYMNEEGTQGAGLTRSIDTCSADANNVLSCTVNGENILQTQMDILTIGTTLAYDSVTVVLVPV